MMSRTTSPPLLAQCDRYSDRTAIIDEGGSFTYTQLLQTSSSVAAALLEGRENLHEERIAFAVTPGFAWVATQWAIWRAGGVAVPLPLSSPTPELEYFMADSRASTLVCDPLTLPSLSPVAACHGIRALAYDGLCTRQAPAPRDIGVSLENDRRAMILYTSGTSNRPKGVVTTHANISAQIRSLVQAWEWSADDHILLCLPLHHVHGIINVVSCALWSGAICKMLPRFDANAVWDSMA